MYFRKLRLAQYWIVLHQSQWDFCQCSGTNTFSAGTIRQLVSDSIYQCVLLFYYEIKLCNWIE